MSTLAVKRRAPQPTVEARPEAKPIILAERDLVIPPSAHTLEGFRGWVKSDEFPQRGRICFLDGEIFIDMSNEELETHVKVKVEFDYGIVKVNKTLKLGTYYGDGARLINPAANLSCGPDGVFLRWESVETGKVRLIPREGVEGQYLEIEGTPDWVMEIVRQTSVRKDRRQLRELYHRAGIPEYWLIDARGEPIDYQILVREETDYVSSSQRGGWQYSPLFGRLFRLTRKRDRLDFWEYTLQIKKPR